MITITYDDISLVPQYSEIQSRHDIDLSTNNIQIGEKQYYLKLPLIGAPMDTVCGWQMCVKLWELGAVGVLHRYNTIERQLEEVQKVLNHKAKCIVAVGAVGDGQKRVKLLYEKGVRAFCIDIAHGNHIFMKQMIEHMRAEYGHEIHIMAGNVCNYDGALNSFKWGADSVRVGVGSGAACTTRIVTGHGVPNLTAIQQASLAKLDFMVNSEYPVYVIADGGVRNSGDAAKALAFGADFVMVGSLIAGTLESPGEISCENGIEYKEYAGMASKRAQSRRNDGRPASIVEGISTKIPYKGYVEDILAQFEHGLKSALSYTGVDNLTDFREKANYVEVSPAGQIESQPHIAIKK